MSFATSAMVLDLVVALLCAATAAVPQAPGGQTNNNNVEHLIAEKYNKRRERGRT
jgi:hypothetical protein